MGRGLEAGHAGQQRHGVVPHVLHRGDALGEQVTEVQAEALRLRFPP